MVPRAVMIVASFELVGSRFCWMMKEPFQEMGRSHNITHNGRKAILGFCKEF